jgi:elongation factor P
LIANDLRVGITIVHDGGLFDVVDFFHTQPGKGGALVKTKLRNLRTGTIIDHTFRAPQKVEQAFIERKKMEYLYRDGDQYYFMDPETYDNVPIGEEKLEGGVEFLKENELCTFVTYKSDIIAVELPDFAVLEIVETDPGYKGDTVSGGSKRVTLETGAVIQGPLFLNVGDRIKVDARTGTYIQRV